MTISIITPFYKGNNYMENYWRMVRANAENLQTYNEEQGAEHLLEVILVNDSPEVTPELDEELMRDTGEASRENPLPLQIQILTNDKNRGIHRSRVNGLHASSGSHIIYLDQDDSICDDAVVIYLKRLAEDGSLAAHRLYVANAILEQDNWESLWFRKSYHKRLVGDKRTYLTVGTQIISPGHCLIPRELITTYWQEHPLIHNGADDYFLWILLLEMGVEFCFVDAAIYTHHFTSANLSGDTTVTDDSTYEFIDIMRASGPEKCKATTTEAVFQRDLTTLEGMVRYKAAFRKAGKGKKLLLSMKHPYLTLCNTIFKVRTATGFGFNR